MRRAGEPDVMVICHGGPISEPADAGYIIKNCRGVDGFYGASSVERLPAERAIAEQIRTFKSIRLPAGVEKAGRDERESGAAAPVRHREDRGDRARSWGRHWWLSKPELTGTRQLTLVRVTMRPGTGHRFHYHPTREEIIYIVLTSSGWIARSGRSGPANAPSFPRTSCTRSTTCRASRCPFWPSSRRPRRPGRS